MCPYSTKICGWKLQCYLKIYQNFTFITLVAAVVVVLRRVCLYSWWLYRGFSSLYKSEDEILIRMCQPLIKFNLSSFHHILLHYLHHKSPSPHLVITTWQIHSPASNYCFTRAGLHWDRQFCIPMKHARHCRHKIYPRIS